MAVGSSGSGDAADLSLEARDVTSSPPASSRAYPLKGVAQEIPSPRGRGEERTRAFPLPGQHSACGDTKSGSDLPDFVSPARAARERSRFPHREAISRKSYETRKSSYSTPRAFSEEMETGSSQKMRHDKDLESFAIATRS
ncbi:hypothetical protein [Methylobacterium sp. SyP6R]|uniref:hypothetical protein n=1 Tax=Methylobacterium sp. SyP6R TaxID=2718876 RepID=UPI001F4320B8|nr:hypothetical protein [Methylobacterium sp. SyP6R]MCF4126172.1 hypothetical protein [Methylobacterium sp. SyP6R]